MVMLNNFLAKAAVGLLSVASSASAFNLERRYANSTSCETQTHTATSLVSVYGSPYTGVPSNKYAAPAAAGSFSGSDLVFDVYVPQSVYDLSGLDLILESVSGGSFNADSFVLYSGDIDHFVYPGAIYSSSSDGLTLEGRTQDPLLKITIRGTHDPNVEVFVANFVLELDVIPKGALVKRDVLTFNLNATASKAVAGPTTTASTESTAPTGSTASTESTTSTGSTASTESTDSTSSTVSTTSTAGSPDASADADSDADSNAQTTSSTATPGETAVLPNGETVVIGSTVTQTITSCSDNKCSEATQTAVGSVIVETVGEVVTSYTTYCPIAVDVPKPKTYVSINKTVTVGTTVVVIDTVCPVTDGKVEKTITATNDNTVISTVVTVTEFVPVSKYQPAIPVPVPTVTPSATATAIPVPVPTVTTTGAPSVPVEQTSTSEGAEHNTVSIYNGAAARSNIASGIVGIFALVMML